MSENKRQKVKTQPLPNMQQTDDLAKNFYRNSVLSVNDNELNVKEKRVDIVETDIRAADHQALNDILIGTLKPHLSKNEKQKRNFKETLMKFIMWVLIAQLAFVGIPMILVFMSLIFHWGWLRPLSENNVVQVFSFLKYYISAIIAEVLAMLFFIVQFVFDKSIVDLVRKMIKD